MDEETPRVDFPALHQAFVKLGQAVAVSDLQAVEAATAVLLAFVARGPQPALAEAVAGQRALIEKIDGLSADVALTLASRLRAYDFAIAAWRDTEKGV